MAIKKEHTSWEYNEPSFSFRCPYCDEYIGDEEYDEIIGLAEPFNGKVKCPHCDKTIMLTVDR